VTAWDDRLIDRARALQLAGDHTIYLQHSERDAAVFVRCAECDQSCARVTGGLTLDDLLSGVLRHLVMGHDMPLSGAGRG
jgi:hypothetical protein